MTYLYVGAAQTNPDSIGGLFRLQNDAWGRVLDENVYAITTHPEDAGVIYAGTGSGPRRSTDHGEHWDKLPLDRAVWSVFLHPKDPRVVYAGTSPTGVWRSDDGGDSWRPLPKATLPERVKMAFPCRVMRLVSDEPDAVYACLEVGGVMRSLDGGETWDDCCRGLVDLAERPNLKSMIQSDTDTEGMLDAHALAVSPARPGTVFLAVRMGLFRSADRGASWEDMDIGRFSPLTYARDVRVSPQDPRVLYACLSPAARSRDGSVWRSGDLGETWARLDHGVKAESTMMAIALHPQDEEQVHCVSRSGQVFSTVDGGKTWQERRLPAGVEDVYALACG